MSDLVHNVLQYISDTKNENKTALCYITLKQNEIELEEKTYSFGKVFSLMRNICFNLEVIIGSSPSQDSYIAIMVSGVFLPILEVSCIVSGYVIVPLDISDPRVFMQLEDIQPKLIITESNTEINKIINSTHWNKNSNIQIKTIQELIHNTLDENFDITEKSKQLNNQSISHIIFTSGSTGRPKGCICSHESIYNYCMEKNSNHGITLSSNVFVGSSPVFDPSLGDFFASWIAGACISFSPLPILFSHLAKCLQIAKSTHLLTTPSMFCTINENPEEFNHLKVVALGGELMPKTIIQKWSTKVRLLNTYGITECCVYQTIQEINQKNLNPRIIGKPFKNIKIFLINVKDDDPLHFTENEEIKEGELLICGNQVALGYLNRPELTEKVFFSHPKYGRCFRTGDIAKKTNDGNFMLLGRKDWQVKIRGNRIELEEIENVLLNVCNSIFNFLICGIKNKNLVAYVVPKDVSYLNDPKKRKVLIDFFYYVCKLNFPSKMIPMCVLINEIFRTSSGKIDRKRIIETFDIVQDSNIDEEDLNSIELLVCSVWSKELGIQIKTREFHFIQGGGDSLVALRICRILITQLKEFNDINSENLDEFGVSFGFLGPMELLKRPTVGEFSLYIQNHLKNADTYTIENDDTIEEDSSNNEIENILLSVCSLDMVDILKWFIVNNTEDVKFLSENSTLLHCSCSYGNSNIVKELLQFNFNPNQNSKQGVTPFQLSVQGSVEIMKLLYQYKASLISRDNSGQTILHYAARLGSSTSVIDWLYSQWTSDKSVKRLFGNSNPFDIKDNWNRTPLHWATVNGHRNVVQSLLLYNANTKLMDSDNETPIQIAERRARCGAKERADHLRPSVFGDIATLLGGSGDTKTVNKYKN